jgi:hypothetical protein
VPIVFENRKQGKSQISWQEIARAVRAVLRLAPHRFRRRPPARPLD